MTKRPTVLSLASIVLGLFSYANAQNESLTADAEQPVRVLLVNSYHFGNPGRDLNNAEAESVLTDGRQAELAALAEALLTFEPTAVAVERTAEPPYDDPVWPEYDEEMLRTVANESVQIGYHVADVAGIDRVYAIDETPDEQEQVHLPYGYFPYPPLVEFAEGVGRAEELKQVSNASAIIEPFEAAQPTSSVPDLLIMYNDERYYDIGDDFYWDVTTFGDGERQPGPELAAYWFLRNAKIFNELTQVTEPGDWVVVVYGAGHGPWLRELTEQTSGYELEPTMPYLERAAEKARSGD